MYCAINNSTFSGLDVVYTGSQKVLASPSGAAPISFSPSAWLVILLGGHILY